MAMQALPVDRPAARGRAFPTRLAVGVLAMLLAGVVAISVLADRETVPVVAAARELSPGAVLLPSDLVVSSVRLPADVLASTVPASELGALGGKTLTEPVHAGQLLSRSEVTDDGYLLSGRMALTISPSRERGPVGRFGRGDWVRVFVTQERQDRPPVTRTVLERAPVYEVGYDSTLDPAALEDEGGGDQRSVAAWLSIAVTEAEAGALANAKSAGQLDVALLPPGGGDDGRGPAAGAPSAPTTLGNDQFRGGSDTAVPATPHAPVSATAPEPEPEATSTGAKETR